MHTVSSTSKSEASARRAVGGVPSAPLQAAAVVAHVDVGQALDEGHQDGHDGVQPVRAHLGLRTNAVSERLAAAIQLIQHVCSPAPRSTCATRRGPG